MARNGTILETVNFNKLTNFTESFFVTSLKLFNNSSLKFNYETSLLQQRKKSNIEAHK